MDNDQTTDRRDRAMDLGRGDNLDMDVAPHIEGGDAAPRIGFTGAEISGIGNPIDVRSHRQVDDTAHVDLTKDDYTPEEAARLMGTTMEVVLHAVYNGDLKALREGDTVVSISHGDLTDWLGRRAAE